MLSNLWLEMLIKRVKVLRELVKKWEGQFISYFLKASPENHSWGCVVGFVMLCLRLSCRDFPCWPEQLVT